MGISVGRPSSVAYLCSHMQCAHMQLSGIHIELHILFHLMAIGGKQAITNTYYYYYYYHAFMHHDGTCSRASPMPLRQALEQLWKYVCEYDFPIHMNAAASAATPKFTSSTKYRQYETAIYISLGII